MQIIAEPEVQACLAKLYADLAEKDFFVVDMESKYESWEDRQNVGGLMEALKVAPQEKPVVMLGWQRPIDYANRREWHAVLAYPHAVFARHPTTATEMEEKLAIATSGLRPADPLALKLLEVESSGSSFGVLRHDLSRALGTNLEEKKDWFTRARNHFGELLDEELLRLVQEGEDTETRAPLAGQEFPDVCVDVEGTLFDQAGVLRAVVLQAVTAFAEERNRPVTVWTGGSTEDAMKRIRAAGILWKLAAKTSLRGAKVYTIFDDLTEQDFRQQYGVNCEQYLQMSL